MGQSPPPLGRWTPREADDACELVRHGRANECHKREGADDADQEKAIRKTHMTFREAATIANQSNAGALWLTHFSPAVADPNEFLGNATAVFPETTIGFSSLETTLAFED